MTFKAHCDLAPTPLQARLLGPPDILGFSLSSDIPHLPAELCTQVPLSLPSLTPVKL